MGPVDFKIGLFIMVKAPDFPAVGIVTELTINAKSLFVYILFGVAGITFLIRIFI